MIVHCCERMTFFLNEGRVRITYQSRFREYGIGLTSASGTQLINYCPWCGSKLPDDLRDKWIETLEGLGHPFPFESKEEGKLPDEFLTDEWWKKRGL